MIPDFERVTAPAYTDSLGELSMETIRQMRAECQELENAASYVRRFAQARLDIIASQDSAPDLAAKLAAGPNRSSAANGEAGVESFARPPQDLEPNSIADQLVVELDKIATPSALSDNATLSADVRSQMVSALSDFEKTISRHRAELHSIIDMLQAEVVRRYRDGLEPLDSLLA